MIIWRILQLPIVYGDLIKYPQAPLYLRSIPSILFLTRDFYNTVV